MREAVAYAIDREAMSDALGYGFTVPLNQMSPPNTTGYNPDYKGRPYNPEKAKQLLKEAGHPNGFKTTMELPPTMLNAGTVVKNYLGEVRHRCGLERS